MTMNALPELPANAYDALVRAALAEDLAGAGDLTTDAIVDPTTATRARIVARAPGRMAGGGVVLHVFGALNGAIEVGRDVADGDDFGAGATVMSIDGPARGVLTGERTALNFLGRLCGIATATRDMVALVAGTKAQIVCTRKTTPGLRALEKYAVRAGGGHNHRFGLYDAVLVKDNHIAIAGGITAAVDRLRGIGHMVKIEVEIDTLAQLEELLELGVEAVLLDNMDPPTLAQAVEMVGGTMLTEASGGVTPATVRAVAEAGVDLISVGWLTHSVKNLDLGLDFESS